MKIAFNPSTVAALTSPPNNKDITFDLRGRNIFARGVKFYGTDTNTWRDIKINNVSIGSNILDLRNGSNTTLTNTNGVVIINSTWRPVVDNLTSNSTTSSLSANLGRVLAGLINGKSDSDHNHDGRYLRLSGLDTMQGNLYLRSYGTSYIGRGSGDKSGADFTEANIVIRSWWGISFKSYDDIVRTYIDTRTGNIGTKGVLSAASAVILGRVYNGGDDEGIIIKPTSNGYAGLILGTHNGERSVFYLTKGNPFWRYNNGSTNLDILHPKKPGVIALTSDIPTSLKNPYALTISLNGTSQGPYDGSAAKNINITPGSIGAAVSNHSHDYLVVNAADDKSFNSAYHNFLVLYAGGGNGITGKPANVDAFGLFKFRAASGWSGQMLLANRGSLYIRSSEDAKMTNTLAWKTILDSFNYSGILDSRYYTESEVNSLLSRKLDRVNLTTGSWNPRGYNLAADYSYNGGNLSISESGGKIHVSVDGYFWLNEGLYRVLDTSDVAGLKGNLTVHLYLSATDTTWWPLIWGGSSHNNTSDSTGAVYKSHDVLSWQTSSLTLYATNIQTNNIKNLSIGGGIYWNPFAESTTDSTDAASITLVRLGVAGGTTLVLSLMNDTNDTILFKTNTAARLYHNNYPILTTLNTYVNNNKGYINGSEITLVNNSDTIDGWHKNNIQWTGYITSGDTLASYWFKMYDITVTGYLYNDITITFLVSEGFSSHFSIFYLRIRLNGTNNSGNYNLGISLYELVGNLRDKVVAYYNNSTGNVLLWGNTGGLWGTMNYTVLKKTTRTATDSYSLGTLTAQSFSSVQTPPSTGYSKVTMSKVGSVSYSDSTGSVHWNNVTNKPSAFNPAAHTHTVFKNNLMIKGTNGISDSASIHLGIGDSDTGFKWISDGVCQMYANNVAIGQWTSGGMNWFANPTVNGNKVWNAGNDGSGSGLDADTLDGYHETAFPRLVGIKGNTWNWNDVIRAGYYKIQSGTITNHPSGIYPFGMAEVITTENHNDGENRELQIYYPHNQTNNIAIWLRMHNSSTQGNGWGSWVGVPNTNGNIASATKLQTPRRIWGQSFDGTSDVDGMFSGSKGMKINGVWIGLNTNSESRNQTIDCDGNDNLYLNYYRAKHVITNHAGGNLGVGIDNPAYKLHVVGDIYTTTGFKKNGSSDSYVLLGGGGHKLESALNVANADTVDGYHYNNFTYKKYIGYNRNGPYNMKVFSMDISSITWGSGHLIFDIFSNGYGNNRVYFGKYEVSLGHWNNTDKNPTVYSRWIFKTNSAYDCVHVVKDLSSYKVDVYIENSLWDCKMGLSIVASSGFNMVSSNSWVNLPSASGTVLLIDTTYLSFMGNADMLDGYHANGLLTALSNSNNGISITVGGTTKSISNINVNYANSAGNADTLDGEHASNFVRAGNFESADLNKLDTYSFIKSVNSNVAGTSPNGNTGWYNVILLVHRNGASDGPSYIGLIALGMTTNTNDMFFRGKRTDSWKTVIHSGNYTEFINNYYWANVKISASSSTTTSPTVSNLTATNSIRMSNISLEHTDEINNITNGGIHLNYRNSGNVSLCQGGGNVGIGAMSPSYKLDVNGLMRASGFRHSSHNNNDAVLLAGGDYKTLNSIWGGDSTHFVFLGYLTLHNGVDGTISDSFMCLGKSVPFTYTRGGAYCRINIPNTSFQTLYIKAAIASVHYSGAGMGHWVGNHRGDGAWWLHCDAVGSNAVQVKGFHLANENNDSWWGGNPLYSGDGAAKIITVCLFGYVLFR